MKMLTRIKEFCKDHRVGIATFVVVLMALHMIGQKHIEAEREQSTHYYDLYYAGREDVDYRHLCTELAAEGECKFDGGNLYEIMFMFPEAIIGEMESGCGDYDIDVTYDSAVEAGQFGYIQVKVFNQKTGQTYIAHSGFEAAEDLCLQEYQVNNTLGERMTFSYYADGVPQGLIFFLDTSSQPDGGSQDIAFSSSYNFGDFAWHIASVEREEF